MHVCRNPKCHNELPDLCVLFWDGLKPRLYKHSHFQVVVYNTVCIIYLICSSQGLFRNSRYSNVDFSVSLPQGMDVCDIGILTVWCQPFDVVFGFVEIPRSKFVSIYFSNVQSLS